MNKHPVARFLGIAAGATLTLLLLGLGLSLLSLKQDDYGAIGIVLIAIVAGVPLLALTLGCSIYLHHKGAAGRRLMLAIWLPIAASAAIVPVFVIVEGFKQEAFNGSHPAIDEVHVNLTGRDLWLDPATGAHETLEGKDPKKFLERRRDPILNRFMPEYDGARLAPGFKSAKVFFAYPPEAAATMLPVVAAPAPASGTRVVYHYYYYSDRVEVAAIPDEKRGGTDFFLHNLGPLPIVRLEIERQPVRFLWAVSPLDKDDCRVFAAGAISRLDAPITVRWQFAQTDPAWHEAKIIVPAFQRAQPATGSAKSTAVDLFFLADGSLSAQRVQELGMGFGKVGVRFTQPAPAIAPPPVCGTAADRYIDSVERLSD